MNTNPTTEEAPVYTDGDYDRLGTMKKAADVVHSYYRWVQEDHRRSMNEKDHQTRINKLVHDVMAVFGLTDEREQLARYFIVNVLQAAQEIEYAAMGRESWAPFKEEALQEVYEHREVSAMVPDLSPHARCMYAGRFMADCTSHLPVLEKINAGVVVGCDLDLVQTGNWEMLLEALDIEDDYSFICVGKAVMRTREMTNAALADMGVGPLV